MLSMLNGDLKRDKKFLLLALVKSGSSYRSSKLSSPFVTMIDNSLKGNKAFISKVLEIEPKLFRYIDDSLQRDKEILALMKEIKHPLWKKIFNPLTILLFGLFGYWFFGRKRA